MLNLQKHIDTLNEKNKRIHFFAVFNPRKTCEMHIENGYPINQLHPINSVTKTLTALTALRIFEEKNIDLHLPISEVLNYPVPEPYKKITLWQCLNMQTGILWDERLKFRSKDNIYRQFMRQKEPLEFLFKQPIEQSEIGTFNYNSAISYLLVRIVETITQQKFETIVQEKVFYPLSIFDYEWEKDITGRVFGGHGIFLSGHDLIKIGQLLLNGNYNNKKIISDNLMNLLQKKTAKHTVPSYHYGASTWHGTIKDNAYYGAFGYGGQRLYIFNSLGIGFAFLGQTHPEYGIQEMLLKKIITDEQIKLWQSA